MNKDNHPKGIGSWLARAEEEKEVVETPQNIEGKLAEPGVVTPAISALFITLATFYEEKVLQAFALGEFAAIAHHIWTPDIPMHLEFG